MSEADIVHYYESCSLDYRINWRLDACQCLHYGYWDPSTRSFDEALVNTHRVMATRAGVRGGERVLDAGCGVGGASLWLAREHRCEVVGITLVPSQVRDARRNARRAGLAQRVRFEERSYLDTGYPDASFDLVWAIESSCYAADKADFFREALRLLRPGGRLVVADFFRSGDAMGADQRRMMERWEASWAIPAYAGFDHFAEQAREAGFEDVLLTDDTWAVRPSARRLYQRFWPGLLVSAWAFPLRIRSRLQTEHVLSAYWQWKLLEQGLWRYGFLSATAPHGEEEAPLD
jgi:cyclopropane fatty-acyl-phospholipid synthase-like methyltransferase